MEIVRRAWTAAWSSPPDWVSLGALYDPDRVPKATWSVNNTVYRASGWRAFRADQDETWDERRHGWSVSSTAAVTP